VTGAALVLLAAWFVRGPAQQALLIATVPVLIFVVWFWPVQGIGNDSDFLGSAFPATYAGAWLIARPSSDVDRVRPVTACFAAV
jgi:hypothetical protein